MKKTILSLMLISGLYQSYACTDIQIKAQDGSIIVGRTMEFAEDLGDSFIVYNKGEKHTSQSKFKNNALSWTTKYAYAGIAPYNYKEVVYDGTNSEGLAVETLLFPEHAKFEDITAKSKNVITPTDFVSWALGNFSNVEQVREAVKTLSIWGQPNPLAADGNTPAHWVVHDKTGNSIVIEYEAGKLNIYDNKIGVMTNSPNYKWHMANLSNYVHLSPNNSTPLTINGVTVSATGQGSGSIGLPGDFTPPSRFIKMAFLLSAAYPTKDADSAVLLASHTLNDVDIPIGVIREKGTDGKVLTDYTMWSVIKDLNHQKIYLKTYNNLGYVAIDLKPFLEKGSYGPVRLSELFKLTTPDLTTQMLKAK
jgi:choloylglycine hydrolase